MLRSVQFQETEHIYLSEELRLTMWYPEDWIYQTDREQITFDTSEDVPG